jgi:hypothetical protein
MKDHPEMSKYTRQEAKRTVRRDVERSRERGKHAPQTVRSAGFAGLPGMITSLLNWTSRNEAVFVYMRGAETVRRGAAFTRSCSCSSGLHYSADGGRAQRPWHRALDAVGAEVVISRPWEATSQKAWSASTAPRRFAWCQIGRVSAPPSVWALWGCIWRWVVDCGASVFSRQP